METPTSPSGSRTASPGGAGGSSHPSAKVAAGTGLTALSTASSPIDQTAASSKPQPSQGHQLDGKNIYVGGEERETVRNSRPSLTVPPAAFSQGQQLPSTKSHLPTGGSVQQTIGVDVETFGGTQILPGSQTESVKNSKSLSALSATEPVGAAPVLSSFGNDRGSVGDRHEGTWPLHPEFVGEEQQIPQAVVQAPNNETHDTAPETDFGSEDDSGSGALSGSGSGGDSVNPGSADDSCARSEHSKQSARQPEEEPGRDAGMRSGASSAAGAAGKRPQRERKQAFGPLALPTASAGAGAGKTHTQTSLQLVPHPTTLSSHAPPATASTSQRFPGALRRLVTSLKSSLDVFSPYKKGNDKLFRLAVLKVLREIPMYIWVVETVYRRTRFPGWSGEDDARALRFGLIVSFLRSFVRPWVMKAVRKNEVEGRVRAAVRGSRSLTRSSSSGTWGTGTDSAGTGTGTDGDGDGGVGPASSGPKARQGQRTTLVLRHPSADAAAGKDEFTTLAVASDLEKKQKRFWTAFDPTKLLTSHAVTRANGWLLAANSLVTAYAPSKLALLVLDSGVLVQRSSVV